MTELFERTLELDLDCSPETVFRHIATEFFQNHPRWDTDIAELTQTSTGPVAMGTTGREVREVSGRRFISEFRIVEFEPGRAFALQTTAGAMAENAEYRIRQGTSGSHLTLHVHIFPRNPLLWLMAPVIRPQIRRNFEANVARFEAILRGLGEPRPSVPAR